MFFSRRAGELADHQVAPGLHLEAAIARLQRRQSYTFILQWQHPCAIRTQARPTAAAEGQQGGIGVNGFFAVGAVDAQTAVTVPTEPSMTGVDNYPLSRRRLSQARSRGAAFMSVERPARSCRQRCRCRAHVSTGITHRHRRRATAAQSAGPFRSNARNAG